MAAHLTTSPGVTERPCTAMKRQPHTMLLSLAAAALVTQLILVPAAALTPLCEPPPPVCPITEPFAPASYPPAPASSSSSVPVPDPDLLGLAAAARRDLVAAGRAIAALARGAAGAGRVRVAGVTVAAASGARATVHTAVVGSREAAAAAQRAAERRRADMAKRRALAWQNGLARVESTRRSARSAGKRACDVAVEVQAWALRQSARAVAMWWRWCAGGGALAVRSRQVMVAQGGVAAGWAAGVVAVVMPRVRTVMQRGDFLARAAVRQAAAVAPRLQDVMRAGLPLVGKAAFAFACVYAGCACLVALLRILLEDKFAQPIGLALYAMMRAQLASLRRQNNEDQRIGTEGISNTDLRAAAELLLAEAEACAAGVGGSGTTGPGVEASVRSAPSAVPKAPLSGRTALRPTLRPRKPRTALPKISEGIANPSYGERKRPQQRKAPPVTRKKQPIRVRYSDSVKPPLSASDMNAAEPTNGGIPFADRRDLNVTERHRRLTHERKAPEREVIVIDD